METEKLLILAKTYPTPSRKYVETTCVAAINEAGQLRRLYPIPYRLLEDEHAFSKWQWVTARVATPIGDRRPESRRADVDSISPQETISTGKSRDWKERLTLLQPHLVPSFAALEARRQATGETLGVLRISRLLGLDITPLPASERDWSTEEKEKLTQDLVQPGLFDDSSKPKPRILEKISYHFHYRYEIETSEGTETLRHLITDWEAGELYRKCVRDYGEDGWEAKFRQRYETEFREKDLHLVMGTVHRFPDQWLIISVVYPPIIMQQTLEL